MEIQIDKACRVCLQQSTELEAISDCHIDSIHVFETMKKILQISSNSILIQESPALPNNICQECIEIMTKQIELNKVAKESEAYLESILDYPFSSYEVFVKSEAVEIKEEECEIDSSNEVELKTELVENDDIGQEVVPKAKFLQKRHQCPTCLKFFAKPSKLKRHQATHDSTKKPFSCDQPGCFQRFVKSTSLEKHAILHRNSTNYGDLVNKEEKIHKCMICSQRFEIQEALASHMRKHSKEMEKMEFPCNLCDKVFKKLNELTRHRRIHPENKNHKCLICSKVFSQASHLADHISRHQGLRPHVCEVCNKSFQQSSTLKDHIRIHSSERPFLCSECGKSFNNPSNFRAHKKRHLNLKEFACHLCPGKYSCKASLESHILSHSGIKPFSCSFCDSTFTKHSSMTKHVRTIHEKIRPFKCELCEMNFHSAEHLKRHFRSHTKEKPYICSFEGCDKAYAQTNDLLKHTKKAHVGELVYKCSMCCEAFRLQSQLRNHYAVHYKDGIKE